MCDFSLHHVKSRPAKVGDKLTTRNFNTGTCGFAAPEDSTTAVCENNKLQDGDLSTNQQGRDTRAS